MFRVPLFFILALLALAPLLVQASSLCVITDRGTLRAGPGTNQKVTWVVGKYMPLKGIEAKSGWIKVQDLDNETHWIASSSVSSRVQCMVVKSKFANLRRSPSSTAPAADIPFADRYTPYRKLDRDGAWVQVEDTYKEKAWVNDANLWWPVTRSTLKF